MIFAFVAFLLQSALSCVSAWGLCLGCGECVLLFQSLCAADMITPAPLVVCIGVRSRMDWDAVPRVLLLGPFRHIPLMSLQRYDKKSLLPNIRLFLSAKFEKSAFFTSCGSPYRG